MERSGVERGEGGWAGGAVELHTLRPSGRRGKSGESIGVVGGVVVVVNCKEVQLGIFL